MAVDTAAKRMSLVGYGMPFRLALPAPDGTLDQGDRQHLAGLYCGILAGAAVVVVTPSIRLTGVLSSCLLVGRLSSIGLTGSRTGDV